ncbi:hypothetical protein PHAVU_002G078500 [Phaseolus vulgaris]|uniref:Uncharacterized protein n=1 Tax=Phaseolus vulgaris TaxID=3885 RepID=V7CH63_PHAVU|nr:hypothetical protein PHAVU_002G078500g [Phaseolus vulgaris]ESW29542.1 hypothetical protein PHAVU_002G078500g [Phaseolus vulgaris]
MKSKCKSSLFLKSFGVDIHPRQVVSYVLVFWFPPTSHWFKCNTDGATKGSPSISGCRGIFRHHHTSIMGCFF